MAGSYLHVVENDGGLSNNETVVDMLENGGDVYEAVEEMYGMIWYLASEAQTSNGRSPGEIIEEARQSYDIGLSNSPTKRYKRP